MFNISFKRVGGLRILKIGRITLTLSIARAYESPAQLAERKAIESARRAAIREELRFNARIGRRVRFEQLRSFYRMNRENTIRQLNELGSDRHPDEIWR